MAEEKIIPTFLLFQVPWRTDWIRQLLYVTYILYFPLKNKLNKEIKMLRILDTMGDERTIECKSKMSAR